MFKKIFQLNKDVKLNLPFMISPSVSSIILHAEETGNSFMELTGWFTKENQYKRIKIAF